jgi:hypothetical protein
MTSLTCPICGGQIVHRQLGALSAFECQNPRCLAHIYFSGDRAAEKFMKRPGGKKS